MIGNLPLSGERLWADLMAMAQIGATPGGGCNRQALTDGDGEGRALLRRWGEALGLATTVDKVGTMRLMRPGRDPGRAPVAIGSHLDTQPSGGRFDGVLGVLAGLEILRAMHEQGAQTEAPIVLVNWSNEEGARFSPPMMASGTAMGMFTLEETLARTDPEGKAFGAELARIGWAGEAEPSELQGLAAYFELHIEQGTVLEKAGQPIGVVTHALAQRWFDVTVTGADSHGGGAMLGRRDAMMAAAQVVSAVEQVALAERGRGTVGRLVVEPDSRNVVPGRVWFSVDMRGDDAGAIGRMEGALRERAAKVAQARGVEIGVEQFWDSPLVRFDAELCGRLRASAQRREFGWRDMPTGIGHDAVYVARKVPAAMLFVPCVGGISHNEAEFVTPEWANTGMHVLADAVLETAGMLP